MTFRHVEGESGRRKRTKKLRGRSSLPDERHFSRGVPTFGAGFIHIVMRSSNFVDPHLRRPKAAAKIKVSGTKGEFCGQCVSPIRWPALVWILGISLISTTGRLACNYCACNEFILAVAPVFTRTLLLQRGPPGTKHKLL